MIQIDPLPPARLSSRDLSDRSRLRFAGRVLYAVSPVPARELAEGQVLRGVCRSAGSDLLGCGTQFSIAAKFCPECARAVSGGAPAQTRFAAPDSYTPKYLADKILTSKAALEGERKHVTVLFADLKGSMELLTDRDPEEARKLLDPVLEHMMEAASGSTAASRADVQ